MLWFWVFLFFSTIAVQARPDARSLLDRRADGDQFAVNESCANVCPNDYTCAGQDTCISPAGEKFLICDFLWFQCHSPLTCCNHLCKNLNKDFFDCGACGNKCPWESKCKNGICKCKKNGYLVCNGQCIDPQTNNSNCGGCNIVCKPPETCQQGMCSCPAPKV
ncbi:hypothetical protein ASPZODRAFT_471109 [Penicilliopsis zonata CBS 506.65]|uniref:4Fe-4S ferredoxin-type domain-containing protein n=1 Tax=Penicilliopsis zonata CBS 506.65 TaxID=1073090 RepID=A0A1L9SEI6_9EURO|nr:hypothetical protein ASPZODRAFT_471109 [Penicilliopsis zonata CBS 506.65]OJJ45548.1 hypothetical protein ASPZODRAFT_471109 [Penicilliopsis zonata CBS 506.65]